MKIYSIWLLATLVLVVWASPALGRQWKDRSGSFSIEADFVQFKDGKVYLEKTDGSVINVPFERLSYADYDYLRTLKEFESYFRDNPLPTEHTVYHIPKLSRDARALAFSPNGKWLAIGDDYGVIMVDWNKPTAPVIPSRKGGYQDVNFCRFTPDGSKLITGRSSGRLEIRRVGADGSANVLAEYEIHKRDILCMEFSPDGRHVLSGDEGHALFYWDLDTGQVVHALKDDLNGYVRACFINPKGTQALAADGECIILYDLTSGKPIQKMQLASWIDPTAISPDGSRVVLSDYNGVRMWKTVEGTELPKSTLPTSGSMRMLGFLPDGKYFLIGRDAAVELWDANSRRSVCTFRTSGRFSTGFVAFSPDNRHFAICSGSKDNLQVFRIPASND